jgi:hypothetical protein
LPIGFQICVPFFPKGFVTMILRCSIEMPNISYAWKELKEQLGESIDAKVKGMVFLKGKLVSASPPGPQHTSGLAWAPGVSSPCLMGC